MEKSTGVSETFPNIYPRPKSRPSPFIQINGKNGFWERGLITEGEGRVIEMDKCLWSVIMPSESRSDDVKKLERLVPHKELRDSENLYVSIIIQYLSISTINIIFRCVYLITEELLL